MVFLGFEGGDTVPAIFTNGKLPPRSDVADAAHDRVLMNARHDGGS
jgi:hypothetical protein